MFSPKLLISHLFCGSFDYINWFRQENKIVSRYSLILYFSVTADEISKSSDSESQCMPNRDMSSIYQEQRVQPCHLSSSIYYGGQDIYSHPQSTQSSLVSVHLMCLEKKSVHFTLEHVS